jgi:hypothetical protein
MGFELNRIMKQYGVNTPGMANYSGADAPTIPVAPTGERPTGDDDAAKAAQTAFDKQKADADAYAKDKTAFNEAFRKYGLDQKSYDTYKTDYQNRLSNTPMYVQSQFDTGNRPVSDAMKWATTGTADAATGRNMGVDKFNANTKQYIADNPYASTQSNQDYMKKYGISNQDVYNATGSYYGNQLKNPTYGAVNASMMNDSPQAKSDYYLQQRNIGYTDADLRNATTSTFGKPAEGDWAQLTARAYPTYNKNIVDAYGSLGRSWEKGTIDAPGYNYWMNQLSSGAFDPKNLNSTFAKIAADEKAAADAKAAEATRLATIANTTDVNNQLATSLNVSGNNKNKIGGMTFGSFTLPGNWDSFGEKDKINWFNTNNVAADTILNTGYGTQADIDYMKNNGYTVVGNQDTSHSVYSHGGSVHDLADKYATGGPVKTHYQTAGPVKLPSGYGSVEEEQDFKNRFFTPSADAVTYPVDMSTPPPPVTVDLMPAPAVAAAPKSALTEVAANNLKAEPMPAAPVTEVVPVAVPKAAAPFGNERMANIQALLASYGPKDSAYDKELTTARAAAKAETDAFARMLTGAMNSPEDAQSSKAEMYFRLAAAFGAPTKTGQFSENLGMVGKELGEYAKGKRASSQQKLALALEAQKMKMTSSKEDLNTLRALAGKEMDDKRAIATELIKDYIKSGEPQSAAGKQALDEGLKPGTEAYQKRVGEIGNMKVEAQMAQITASLANMNTAAANLALSQEKFQNQKAQQAKLTGPEMKLKVETEDTLAQTGAALGILKQAYALNPNTFDTSISDMAQRKALEVTNSKHPKVVATREQENLLEKAALAQLKSTFPGAISNDERKALQDVQGLGAKSIEERGKIMKNAYKALQSVHARHTKRLADINQGAYRDTAAPIEGGPD